MQSIELQFNPGLTFVLELDERDGPMPKKPENHRSAEEIFREQVKDR